GGDRYEIESPEKYKLGSHDHARLRDQELIFLELLDYAKWAASNGYDGPQSAKRKYLRTDYKSYDDGYAGVLYRFFKKSVRSVPLRDFFAKLHIYTDNVLQSPYGSQTVIGKARDFSFRDPHNPLPEKNLIYLQDVEKLLKVKDSPTAKWFRPDGPLFSDFEDKRIYRRSILDALKNAVLKKPVYLLKGDVATGKSVIVRYLMYELLSDDHKITYYFDVSGARDFKRDRLLREILSISGIIIIENVHLEVQKISRILSSITHDENRHILLTARTSIDDFRSLFHEEIYRVESETLPVFEEADKIIDCFLSHCDTPSAVCDRRAEIFEISKNNFWLLSFALLGCADYKGKGKPESWISSRVNKYLMSLKELKEDKYYRQYPKIVLALCPLYKNEVLTEQKFLVNELHLNEDAIEDLARRGEIKYQKDSDGNVFYGLSHSSLADAYWNHGKEYRKDFPEYEDFLYNYAVSGAHNGLRAIVYTSNRNIRIIERLLSEGKIRQVIKEEKSLGAIYTCFSIWPLSHRHKSFMSDDLLHDLVERISYNINSSKDASFVIDFIVSITRISPAAGRKVVRIIDLKELARKISNLGYMSVSKVEKILECDKEVGRSFWKVLDVKKILCEMESWEDPCASSIALHDICAANQDAGRELWQLWNWKAFNREFTTPGTENHSCNMAFAFWCISDASILLNVGLCEILNFKNFAERLSNLIEGTDNPTEIGHRDDKRQVVLFLARICRADKVAGDKLCNLINNKEIVACAHKIV
ncbi:MAG: hypothetical protein HQ557_12350, partial [Bacteroidetes bacterium]|nr:hypothetical protein [Bacteroidota bacterium]